MQSLHSTLAPSSHQEKTGLINQLLGFKMIYYIARQSIFYIHQPIDNKADKRVNGQQLSSTAAKKPFLRSF